MTANPHKAVIPVSFLFLIILAGWALAQPIPNPIVTPAQDKAFSEFNHHIAGWFLIGIGSLAIIGRSSPKLAFAEKIWPFLFILPGIYLAAMSDPGVWPMGEQSWAEAFRTNTEAMQHKIYAALLLALGVIEFMRSRGKLGRLSATWSFPLLAAFGAVLLFFHEHASSEAMNHSMQGMDHASREMAESMAAVKIQHFWFSCVGFCVMLFKFLSDGNFWKRTFVPYLWPAAIAVLGVLLLLYRE